ncbi:Conserved_hypothetical protein [Hexamita inflata]|uniref:Uncharacterized protein n=1 Tax=Hexamita inflata TaxID=28002 RepID=A0AA86UK36_9EUKA|nr:Conserved hypothetical protein [Hexamita inflata]
MIASIVLVKQLTYNKESMCANNILIGNDQYNYCAKSKNLNNQKIVNEIFFQQYSNSQLFMNTDSTQKSVIDIQVYNYNVNVFVLFGLVGASQNVVDSKINISLNFPVFQGALICVQCDVYVTNCTLVFIATGKAISCVLIEARSVILIQQTFIQFRISSFNSSGIANKVNHASVIFSITDCKLTGSNLLQSGFNGYISCQVLVPISVVISSFFVCVGNTSNIGNESEIVSFTGAEIDQCDLCDTQFVVYGLCLDSLKYGTQVGNVLECYYPFIFQDIQCTCDQGYVLDSKKCVNILQALRNVTSTETGTLSNRIDDIATELLNVDARISNNASSLQTQIINTQSELESQMSANVSQLTNIMFNNVAALENNILGNASILIDQVNLTQGTLENYIIGNATVLDWRIYNNFTVLNQSFNVISQKFQLILQEIKLNFSALNTNIEFFKQNQSSIITDNKNDFFKKILELSETFSNLTYQVNCTNVVGQQYINDSCVNVSCPFIGQLRVNGICKCKNSNSIIQGNSCVCPLYSTVLGSSCTCPVNSILINEQCVCKFAGQIIQSGQCVCSVVGALVSAEACVCPTDYVDLNGVCQNIFQISELQCGQGVYTTLFEISTQTHFITSTSNFTNGYVFSASAFIQNAFIDISDNIYTSSTQQLFQSQSTLLNMKIQFGTELLNNCSLILPVNSVITINQVKIISREGSEFIVNAVSQLNILTSSLQSAVITNLLIDLSFAQSYGNITLINYICCVINITGYEVLGKYVSSFTVAMIGIIVDNATIYVNYVSFKPSIYNVGNGSSYIFGSDIKKCTLSINDLAIFIGRQYQYSNIVSISTNDYNTNYYLFGGIIAQINNASIIQVNNLIMEAHQKTNTGYVSKSGFLFGNIQSIASIIITNVCLLQKIIGSTTQFSNFGLIGFNKGQTQLCNASIKSIIYGTYFQCFGILGYQDKYSLIVQVSNLQVSLLINSGLGTEIGSIFGSSFSVNCQIYNTSVLQGNISIESSSKNIGGFVGYQGEGTNTTILDSTIIYSQIYGQDYIGGLIGFQYQNANLTILNLNILQTSIFSSTQVGGYIGYQYNFSNTTIQDSKISQTQIHGSDYVGGLLGVCSSYLYLNNSTIQLVHLIGVGQNIGVTVGWNNNGMYSFTSSSSQQNYIQNIQTNCPILQNQWSVTGC